MIIPRLYIIQLTIGTIIDKRPTPNPEMIRPSTIIMKLVLPVCIAPPMIKTVAPQKSVRFLPILSPIVPARSEVTRVYQKLA